MNLLRPRFGLKSFFLAMTVIAGASAVVLHDPYWRKLNRLRSAISDGDAAALAADLEGMSNPNPILVGGQSALHYACRLETVEIVRTLVEHGASIESRDRFRQTPLHIAAHYGRTNVAHYLLNLGANADARDDFNRPPAELAATAGHYQIAKRICRHLGEKAADRDIAAGVLCLRVAGYPSNGDYFRRCANYIADTYSIHVEHVGCIVTDVDFTDGYHARVEQAIVQRFGRSVDSIYDEAARCVASE